MTWHGCRVHPTCLCAHATTWCVFCCGWVTSPTVALRLAVMLHRTCEVLVQYRHDPFGCGPTLVLCWDKPSLGLCHEVLSGLAPLQAAPVFDDSN